MWRMEGVLVRWSFDEVVSDKDEVSIVQGRRRRGGRMTIDPVFTGGFERDACAAVLHW